ncbi:hypothetical protein MMC18_003332 [Xylographa bjoerkii]|nr:hypothetical protein [Xylographa bjoerkii]
MIDAFSRMKIKVYGKKRKGLLGSRSAMFEQESPNANLEKGLDDFRASRPVLKERSGNSNGERERETNLIADGQGIEHYEAKCWAHTPQDVAGPAIIKKHRKKVDLKAVDRLGTSAMMGNVANSDLAPLYVSVDTPPKHEFDAIGTSHPHDLLSLTKTFGPKKPMDRERTKIRQNSSWHNMDEVAVLLQDKLVVTETSECHHNDSTTIRNSTRTAAPAFHEQPIPLDTETASYVSPLLACKNVSGRVENFQAWTDERMPLLNLQKIGEGSFGEVYRASNSGETVIMKIIPLNARKGQGSRTFTSIEAAANEVQLLEKMQRIPGFVELRGACVLQGSMPTQLIKEWNDYKAHGRTVESRDPNKKNVYRKNQLWLLLEMSDAGTNLNPGQYMPCDTTCHNHGNRYLSVHRSWDIFWQIVRALAKAEVYANFEHRDLHLGNICARNTRAICDKEDLTLIPSGEATPFSLDNTGVQVTIIDYSLARAIAEESQVLSYDFMKNDSILTGEGDLQYDVYRYMAEAMGKKSCREFVPKTNVLWLSYLIVKLLEVTVGLSEEAKFQEDGLMTVTAKMKVVLEEVRSTITLSQRENWLLQSAGELLELATQRDWVSLVEIIDS